ncbi:MAG: serine hydrolase [Vagococcus sp.]
MLTILAFFVPLQAYAVSDSFSVDAKAAIAVDFETGKILYEQNIDEPLGIASMTKLVAAYLVYDAIENGSISWDDSVPISRDLVKMSQNPNLSNIPLNTKQTYTVKDLLSATLISSANAATAALAEYIAGSEPKFVDLMREQLKDWGIDDAYIITSSGLGNEDMDGHIYPGSGKKDENMMSARSMAIVSQKIIADFPNVLDITAKNSDTIFEGTSQEYTFWSSNEMLPDSYFYMEGIDGLKTGTTELAGNCFAGTITRNNRRIITVVMNANPNISRFSETANLINHVFDTWYYDIIGKKGDPAVQATIDTKKGKKQTVPLILENDLSMWVHTDSSTIKQLIKIDDKQVDKHDRVTAPKEANYYVGNQYAYDSEDTLDYLTKQEKEKDVAKVKVVTKGPIEKANIFLRFWHFITQK